MNLREEYKRDLIRTFNDLVAYVRENIRSFSSEQRLEYSDKVSDDLNKLKLSFDVLNLDYTFDKNFFTSIDITQVVEIVDDTQTFETFEATQSDLSLQNSLNNSDFEIPNISTDISTDTIEQTSDTMSPPTPTQAQTVKDFIQIAHNMINYRFSGDPLALDSFIDSIDLLKDLCEDNNKNILLKFVMTKLEGKAREAIMTNPRNVDDIITQLRSSIKFESSKVIEGRILALRSDKTSLTKFAERAEELSDQYRRSLVAEGFTREKAKELTIEKAKEICRKNTRSDRAVAIIESTQYSEPKEVIAKMIIEINKLKTDRQQTNFSQDNVGNENENNFSGNRTPNNDNKRNNNYNNSNNNGQNRSNNNDNSGSNGNRSNFNNNGNGQNNSNRTDRYYNRRNNDQPVRRISGNETSSGDSEDSQ